MLRYPICHLLPRLPPRPSVLAALSTGFKALSVGSEAHLTGFKPDLFPSIRSPLKGLPADFEAFPVGSETEALPTCSDALPIGSEAHPAGSEALPACLEALPACSEALPTRYKSLPAGFRPSASQLFCGPHSVPNNGHCKTATN